MHTKHWCTLRVKFQVHINFNFSNIAFKSFAKVPPVLESCTMQQQTAAVLAHVGWSVLLGGGAV